MIGILGGTFDPIHIGHLLIAEGAVEALSLERVLFVPAGDPPHKRQAEKTVARHRRAMVELAIEDNPRFKLSGVDLDRAGPHYSVDTVSIIKEKCQLSAEECFFIIGGDSLADLPTWHAPETLLAVCRLVVVHRPGYQPDMGQLEAFIPGISTRLNWVESPTIALSSSEIRAKLAAGQSIRYQVPEPVRKYILRHRLYGTGDDPGSTGH